jgi:hypothetical protein
LIDLIECGTIKCDNFSVSKILVDQIGGRLLAATREGCLLFFDINGVIQLIYQMRVVLKPDLNKNFVKQIELDSIRNLLLLKLKNNDVLVI